MGSLSEGREEFVKKEKGKRTDRMRRRAHKDLRKGESGNRGGGNRKKRIHLVYLCPMLGKRLGSKAEEKFSRNVRRKGR